MTKQNPTAKEYAVVAKLLKAYRSKQLTEEQESRLKALDIDFGRTLVQGVNDLASTHPDVALSWHPTKNGDLKPTDVMAGSGRKVWWRHQMPDGSWHEWESKVQTVVKYKSCPICSGRKILVGFNDLETTNPELVTQWHCKKNGDLKPTDVTRSSEKKVWWQCSKCGRIWQAMVKQRAANASGCPWCDGYRKGNPVVCIETGQVYSSARQASIKVCGKEASGITECCKGRRKTAGGYHWRYADKSEYPND